jgi:hypothetical protein
MRLISKTYYYLLIAAIIIVSFFLYSCSFYPRLNSDDALNVLMAFYYKLPHDFYCWGQDRGGTLIPLLSQVGIKLFKLPALLSVSLSNYLILILGFIGFSSLLKSNFTKVVFAIIWFLPVERFIDLLRYPIGVQYSLTGFIIFIVNKVRFGEDNHPIHQHLLLIAISILTIVAVWVSDFALVTIAILAGTLLFFHFSGGKKHKFHKAILYHIAGGIIAGVLFIMYAKGQNGLRTEAYYAVNGLNGIRTAFVLLVNSFLPVFAFKSQNTFISVYTFLAILTMWMVVYCISRKIAWPGLLRNKWFMFFTADFIIVFLALLLSSWVKENGVVQRYFVGNYITLSMAVLIAVEQLQVKQIRVSFVKILLLLVAIIGSISTLYSMRFIYPKTFKPMARIVGEYKQLGETGIIAHYWSAYISACSDPEMIIATPHDQDAVRNRELVDMVFKQKNLYIISDWWLSSFPDTMKQFDHLLVKDGFPFKMGGQTLCKYKKVDDPVFIR